MLSRAIEHHRPKGVVGIVSPWNYPLSLAVTDALPALLAGNAVVLRPDLQGVADRAGGRRDPRATPGCPRTLLQVVLGHGEPTGQAVVDLADYVSFTGSTATGRRVAQAAGRRLVGVSLELGGKNTMYVAADADLRRAVAGAVRACFSSAGQLCISAERLRRARRRLRRVRAAVRRAVVGGCGCRRACTGAPTWAAWSARPRRPKVLAHIDDAVAKGARVLTGGRARPDVGPLVVEPTVLEGVTSAMACRDEETFGPVVSLYRVTSDDEAVRLANDTEYGLNAVGLDARRAPRSRGSPPGIQAGTVNINEGYAATWGSVAAPMGGMKSSGLGRRHGREGLLKYTEAQNITVPAPRADRAVRRDVRRDLRPGAHRGAAGDEGDRPAVTATGASGHPPPRSTSTSTSWWSGPASAAR